MKNFIMGTHSNWGSWLMSMVLYGIAQYFQYYCMVLQSIDNNFVLYNFLKLCIPFFSDFEERKHQGVHSQWLGTFASNKRVTLQLCSLQSYYKIPRLPLDWHYDWRHQAVDSPLTDQNSGLGTALWFIWNLSRINIIIFFLPGLLPPVFSTLAQTWKRSKSTMANGKQINHGERQENQANSKTRKFTMENGSWIISTLNTVDVFNF